MSLYPNITRESILLNNDCKRLIKRRSRQLIIDEVMHKLSEKNNIDSKNNNNNKSLYEIILIMLGCNNKYM